MDDIEQEPQTASQHTHVPARPYRQQVRAELAAYHESDWLDRFNPYAVYHEVAKSWSEQLPALGNRAAVLKVLLHMLAVGKPSDLGYLHVPMLGTAEQLQEALGLGESAAKEAKKFVKDCPWIGPHVERDGSLALYPFGQEPRDWFVPKQRPLPFEGRDGARSEADPDEIGRHGALSPERATEPGGAMAPDFGGTAPESGAVAPPASEAEGAMAPDWGAVYAKSGAMAPPEPSRNAPLHKDPRVGWLVGEREGLVGQVEKRADKNPNQPDPDPARAGRCAQPGAGEREPAAWPPPPGSPEPPPSVAGVTPGPDFASGDAGLVLTACGVLGRVVGELVALGHVDADRVRATWCDVATDETVRTPIKAMVWRLRQLPAVLEARADERAVMVAAYEGRVEREERERREADRAAGVERVETARRVCIHTHRDDRPVYDEAWATIRRRRGLGEAARCNFLGEGREALVLAAEIERVIQGEPFAEERDEEQADAEAAWAARVAAGAPAPAAEPEPEPLTVDRAAEAAERKALLHRLAAADRERKAAETPTVRGSAMAGAGKGGAA